MEKKINIRPSDRDIRAQLKRMLECARFTNSPSQVAVLEVIVDRSLKNLPTNENSIGEQTFPGFIPDESTDVRVNVSNLRKTLKEYYLAEGSHDSVTIEVRKGKNYPVKFAYNPKSPAVREYLNTLDFISNVGTFPDLFARGFEHIVDCLGADNNFALGLSLEAEMILCDGMWERSCETGAGLARARSIVRHALEIDPLLWRAHVADGACCLCSWDWMAAENAFSKAHKLSPEETEGDPWYSVYLISVGRNSEAFDIGCYQTETKSFSSIWGTVYGLCEYASGDLGRQLNVPLLIARSANPTSYLVRAATACTNLTSGLSAIDGIEAIRDLFPDLRVVTEGQSTPLFLRWHTKRRTRIPLIGLKALFLANENRLEEAREIVRELEENMSCEGGDSPWDLALAYLSVGMIEKTLEAFNQAVEEHHPLMIWMHLWPFLEPLHKEPKFIDLFNKMNIPDRRNG
jgi:hypothetical protein